MMIDDSEEDDQGGEGGSGTFIKERHGTFIKEDAQGG